MLKKNLLFAMICFLIGFGANAQLRHIEGFKAVGLNGGLIKNGFTVGGSYSYYFASKHILKAELAYERIKFENTNWNNYYLEPQYLYTAWKYKSWYFLDLKAGLIIGNEQGKNAMLQSSKSKIYFGEELGLENEFFINDKFSAILSIGQRFYQKSELGNTSWVVKIGTNYNF